MGLYPKVASLPLTVADTSHAPSFKVYASDVGVGADLSGLVLSIEYETSVDAMAQATIEVTNPDFRFSDNVNFLPGRPLDIYLGYGADLTYVGRVEISRHIPNFPDDGGSTLEIVGFDRSMKMSKQETDVWGGKKLISKKLRAESGKPHEGNVVTILNKVLSPYVDKVDIDPDLAVYKDEKWVQVKGTTDLSMIRALANFYSAWFYCEYVPDLSSPIIYANKVPSLSDPPTGKWWARFVLPESTDQTDRFVFTWARGGKGTLRNVKLEFAIDAIVTEVQAYVWNRVYWRWVPIVVNDETLKKTTNKKANKPLELSSLEYGGPTPGSLSAPPPFQTEEAKSMSAIKLECSGYAVDILTQPFTDEKEATAWLESWFQQHKNAFLIAEGTLPGNPRIRVGDTHRLEGLGTFYSGDYYFATVTHKWTQDGYSTEFVARKIVS